MKVTMGNNHLYKHGKLPHELFTIILTNPTKLDWVEWCEELDCVRQRIINTYNLKFQLLQFWINFRFEFVSTKKRHGDMNEA